MPNCKNCRKEFSPSKFNPQKRYCSKKCARQDYYVSNKDKEKKQCAAWYKKNRESELKKNAEYRRQNKELFKWYHNKERFNGLREEIIKRDNSKCQICGNNDYDYLVVHHIDGRNFKKENTNNDKKNLVTLCRSCHNHLHRLEEERR